MKKNTMKRTTYNKIWNKIVESGKSFHYRGATYNIFNGELQKHTDEDTLLVSRGIMATVNWQTIEVID